MAIERFRPLPIGRTSLLGMSTSDVLPHLSPSARLMLHGEDDPLQVIERREGRRTTHRLVDERLYAEFGLGVGLFDRLQVGVALPLLLQTGQTLPDATGDTGESAGVPGVAFGDLRLAPRLQLLSPDNAAGLGLALAAPLHLPVGSRTWYASAGNVRAEPRLAVDWRPASRVLLAANAGYALRPRRQLRDRVLDDVVVLGLGTRLGVGPELSPGARLGLTGTVTTEIPTVGNDTPTLEALGAVRIPLGGDFLVEAGGGAGVLSAIGSPDARVLLSVEYAPVPRDRDGDRLVDEADRCPGESEDLDGFHDEDGCPDADNDGDGVADAQDACPDQAEDPDGFEDADGCPDPDNDGDGLADLEDACPDEAGVADKDGCPIVDADGDGIDDSVDADPNAAEDFDGFQDDDGAPDPDNDSDGIADAADDCPDRPETINGTDDADGCPDEGESSVFVKEGKIEIDEKIYFDSDRATIKQRSFGVLEQVAAMLKAQPQIRKVRIEGHTDGKGRAMYNLALSQRRANAVRAFLVDRGVDEGRLTTRGYGENEPIAENDTAEGRSANRRVEMTILEVEDDDAPKQGTTSHRQNRPNRPNRSVPHTLHVPEITDLSRPKRSGDDLGGTHD